MVGSATRNARAISAGAEPAQEAEGQRDLGGGGQRRVAAREDQA